VNRLAAGMNRLAERVANSTVPVLAMLATVLLGVSTVLELSNTNARTELWFGAAAGVTFLIAVAASRGSDAHVLALRARLLVGAGLSALLAVAALWEATERAAPRILLLLIPVGLLFTTAALALREAGRQRHLARIRELASRHAGEEAERRRWVRELHDDTLQELAAVHVLLAAAVGGDDPHAPATTITEARDIVARQIHALRRLISRMRPLALDTLGLAAALEDLARHTNDASGITIQVRAAHLPRLPIDIETTIYRIVQEALTNAARHSGATRVVLDMQVCDRAMDIAVADDGHPNGPFTEGHGLTGMRERAETLGGQLRITSTTAGTTIHLHVPRPVPAPGGSAQSR
jgi:signal transduction histidine kinase